ncbi:MAG: molybdate ABC transporter substrate-binding protein [Spirochaetales bacterium]|nr:molybdate ABC transporter substrate-binding protein [Spirochaetales bacterium]
MKKRLPIILTITIFLLLPIGIFSCKKDSRPSNKGADEAIQIFAAASTYETVLGLASLYKESTGVELKVSPAGSGTLARQIVEGAPADIFISASGKWIEYLREEGQVKESAVIAENGLALISSEEEFENFLNFDFARDGSEGLFINDQTKLALGDPKYVPAGTYGQEALLYYEKSMPDARRLLLGPDVRTVLHWVETNECPLGIVYSTDVLSSEKVRTVYTFPSESHSPIKYYGALLEDAAPEGADFYRFITEDEEAAAVLTEFGFIVNP